MIKILGSKMNPKNVTNPITGLDELVDTLKEWAVTDKANMEMAYQNKEDEPHLQYVVGCEERSKDAYNMGLLIQDMVRVHPQIDLFKNHLTDQIAQLDKEIEKHSPSCKGHRNTIMPHLRQTKKAYAKILKEYVELQEK